MKRFLAIFKKEFRQIRRDPLSLTLLIFVPVVLLVLYGYALSFDVKHIPVAVLDEDRTPESRLFLDGLFQNPYRLVCGLPEIDQGLKFVPERFTLLNEILDIDDCLTAFIPERFNPRRGGKAAHEKCIPGALGIGKTAAKLFQLHIDSRKILIFVSGSGARNV